MFYGENIGEEKKDCEYKVFTFNPLKISCDDALIYLANAKFVFNDSVVDTIKNYLQTYLPKYICSYYHPNSEISLGYFYIGVSDDGTVSGIPYVGQLNLDFINCQIDEVFSKLLKFTDIDAKKKVRNNIKCNIINVKINAECFPQKNSIYSIFTEEQEKIKSDYIKYNKKKLAWIKMYDPNILKLCDMINDNKTRNDIWTYTKEKTNYLKKNFKNKYSYLEPYCDVPNYWDLIARIRTGYNFIPLEPGQIVNIKDNPLNIYNWVTRWKDSKINMLKLAKPRLPKKTLDPEYPIFLLSQATKMMPEWIKNNPELNLYVLKITFNTKTSCEIEYKDLGKNWKKSYRTIIDGEPMCLTYKISS
jgi:hypothetical protein